MHRFIINAPTGREVDHLNGDGLDNRRDNIRLCNSAQNKCAFRRKRAGSTSKYRGVYWHAQKQKWRVRVKKDGKDYSLGLFASEIDAAVARDAAALRLHGKYAHLNFVALANNGRL